MKTFEKVAAQGDVYIRRIDSIPEGGAVVEPDQDGRVIVAHSESGHHHWIDGGVARLQVHGDFVSYLDVTSPTPLEHAKPGGHEPILLAPGRYKLTRGRESVGEAWRRIED